MLVRYWTDLITGEATCICLEPEYWMLFLGPTDCEWMIPGYDAVHKLP